MLLAVSAGLVGFPLIYALNLFAVTRLIAPEFRPHPTTVAISCLGILFAITGAALLFATRVLA